VIFSPSFPEADAPIQHRLIASRAQSIYGGTRHRAGAKEFRRMRISFLVALAAATALVPVAAHAQDHHDRSGWHGGSDGGRGDRGQAARPAPAATPRTQAGGWRGNANRGGWENRGDRPQVPQARPDNGSWHESVGGNRGQADWRGRNGDNGGNWHQSVGNDHSRSDGHGRDNGNRGDWQQGRDGHRNDWNRGNDWNRSSQSWRDHDRYSDRFRGNQAFNHDWRRDNRYDWRDYRARNRAIYHLPRYYAPYGWDYGYRRFGVGFTLNSVLFGPNYWIGDPWAYRLPPAYGPYRWVRYYDDALLVDIRTGYVVDVVYDIFW